MSSDIDVVQKLVREGWQFDPKSGEFFKNGGERMLAKDFIKINFQQHDNKKVLDYDQVMHLKINYLDPQSVENYRREEYAKIWLQNRNFNVKKK